MSYQIEAECDRVRFWNAYFIKIKIDDIILEKNLPKLNLDNSANCATSLGTVDVSKLPPS